MRLILGDATARTRAFGTVAAFMLLSLQTTGAVLLTRTSLARPRPGGPSALSQWQPWPQAAFPLYSLPVRDAGDVSSDDLFKIGKPMHNESEADKNATIVAAPMDLLLDHFYSLFSTTERV